MADRSASSEGGAAAPLPPFEGAETVLQLLDDMITEPGWFQTRGDWPLIWLEYASPRHDLLRPLAARYHALTPTAWVDGTETADRSGAIQLLRELVDGLRTGKPRVGNGSFRRFDFVYWLAHQHLAEDGRPTRRELALRHRRYLAGDPTIGDLDRTVPTDSWWSLPIRLVLAVLVRIGYGMITRLLPHYRWLRRQRYLNRPVSVTDVLDLAVRATQPHPPPNQQADLEKLLVHALLADLERRAPARWWPVTPRRRSRAPVLLFVDNLTDTRAADGLLRLIAAVRNETGEPDPVVLVLGVRASIRSSDQGRDQGRDPDRDRVPPRTPRRGESWIRGLTRRRRTSTTATSEPSDGRDRQRPAGSGDPPGKSEAERPSGDDLAGDTERTGTDSLPPGDPEARIALGRPGAESLLDIWRVQHRNTARTERSWRLHLTVPADLPAGQHAEAVSARMQARPLPPRANLPAWSVATAVVAVVGLGAGGIGFWWYAGAQERCGVLFPASDTRLAEARPGYCIGVTDLTDYTFSPPRDAVFGQDEARAEHRKLRRAQERIRQNNERVLDSGRPYVTVVYFSAIADREAAGGTVAAPRAELEGLAIAQVKRFEDAQDAPIPQKRPLLRVLVANAGPAMTDAARVARMIDDLYQSTLDRPDPIVGVVGLGQSVSELEDAMRVLRPSGLPLIGSITSYDGLPEVSTNYFQVGPNNQRQARVAAYYASRTFPDARELLVVRSSAQNDTYSRNLANQVAEAFARAYREPGGRPGLTVRDLRYETAPDSEGMPPEQLGQRICDHEGLVFFAGRAQDLAGVATHMKGCIRAGSTPEMMAGDDVSRAVLEGALDGTGLELTYVPLATSATDERGNCTNDRTASWMAIYRLNESLFDGTCPDSSDGRMLLIYDAVEVLLQATDLIADTTDDMSAVSGPGARTAVEQIRGPNAIDGVSGLIDFGQDRDNRVPVNKAVSVLRIRDGESTPELLLRCGPLYGGDTSSPEGCPR